MSPVDRAYQEFANAIVKKAADDYRRALNGVGDGGRSPESVIKEVEIFFRSKYFQLLTTVKGEYLIEMLRKEHEENERSNHESNISASDAQAD